jgi:hypothetical protein
MAGAAEIKQAQLVSAVLAPDLARAVASDRALKYHTRPSIILTSATQVFSFDSTLITNQLPTHSLNNPPHQYDWT